MEKKEGMGRKIIRTLGKKIRIRVTTADKIRHALERERDRAIAEEMKYKIATAQDDTRRDSDGYYPEADDTYADREAEAAARNLRFAVRDVKKDRLKIMNAAETTSSQIIFVLDQSSATRTQTLSELHLTQDRAFHFVWKGSPVARAIVEAYKRYTIGRGVLFGCQVPEIKEVLDKFWWHNNMELRHKDMVESVLVEGELFPHYTKDIENGLVYMRKIPPTQVYTIETSPDDMEMRLAYERIFLNTTNVTDTRYYKDMNYDYQDEKNKIESVNAGKFVDDVVVQMIKYGPLEEVRGRVPLHPVMKWLRMYDDWLMDMTRLTHEQARVIMKEIWSQSGSKGTEFTTRIRKSPPGGYRLREIEGSIKYEFMSPDIKAGELVKVGRSLLHQIGAQFALPLFMLVASSEDEKGYATIRKSDTPFSQAILDNQDFWTIHFNDMAKVVLRTAMEASKNALSSKFKIKKFTTESEVLAKMIINKMVIEKRDIDEIIKNAKQVLVLEAEEEKDTLEIPIAWTFPDVVRESELDHAKTLEIHKKLGLASDETLSKKAGYDWEYEQAKMREQASEAEMEKLGKEERE